MKYHEIYDVFIIKNDKKIKAIRSIFFEDDDLYSESEKILSRLLKLNLGIDYDKIELSLVSKQGTKINNHIKSTEMATEKENKETGLSLFEEQAKKLTLPAIPKVMTIGGIKFSEEEIKKEVEEVKKIKVQVPLPTDTQAEVDKKVKVYKDLKDKRNKFVKTRTAPDNFRKELTKPIADWQKNLKAQTDSYGAIAKEGEEYCDSQIAIYENYLEEQERLQREAIELRVKERSQQLSEYQAVKNFDSGHWTLPYAPHILIESDSLEQEEGWNEIIAELEVEYATFKQKQEEDKRKLDESAKALVGARTMLLDMMGYKSFGDSFVKNGFVIKTADISTYSDEDWKNLLSSHNAPAPESTAPETEQQPAVASNPFAATPVTNSNPFAQAQPVQQSVNPFAVNQPEVHEPVFEGQNVASEMIQQTAYHVANFSEENPFYEANLKVSTLRVYHKAYTERSINIPNRDERITFSGDLSSDLGFIIYKK